MEDNDRGSPKLGNDLSHSLASLEITSSNSLNNDYASRNSSSTSSSSTPSLVSSTSSTSNVAFSSSPSSSATTGSVTSTPSTTYSPPSLVLLSAITVAENINSLLLHQSENFYYLTEENLLLVFTMVVQNMKLTPKIVLGLREIALQRGYTVLQQILNKLDVPSGIFITGNTQCRDAYF